MTIYFCCDETRRNLVRAHSTLNGIDFLEVQDDPTMVLANRQRFLLVKLLKPPANPLTPDNIRIEGGEAVRDISVLNVTMPDPTDLSAPQDLITVEVDVAGDYSTYTLRLVATATSDEPPATFDRLLSAVDFSFKVNCDTDFDCDDLDDCPPPVFNEPKLDYMARDFNSLRQMMLDRIRILIPEWREDHVADFLQAMIDLKAYVGDYQHYQLDAVNTEAYLFTARSRVSVRRHARLLDYRMHDGCSARVWAHIRIDPGVTAGVTLPKRTQLFTRIPGAPPIFLADTQTYREALTFAPEVFETMHDALLYSAHNFMCFYTWGDDRCILPRGATKATLQGSFPDLAAGDMLLLEEVRGAETGDPADADPGKRFVVRLIAVSPSEDPLNGQAVTEIRWHNDDALPAPLCLSAAVPPPPEDWEAECNSSISLARGNLVLADHGRTLPVENLGTVPVSTLAYVEHNPRCDPAPQSGANNDGVVPPRFRPRLKERPVSQVVAYDSGASATGMMRITPSTTLPDIELAHSETFDDLIWKPQRDLLGSTADKTAFVLEVDNDGDARIRFGDDEYGKRPNAGELFFARYRVGDLMRGNIGRDALAHAITNQTAIVGVRNPLPGIGGAPPESIEAVRQNAPQAFRVQERAVTPADYEAVALRFPGVQHAAATIRWTGSWYTVFLTVDRLGGQGIDADFERAFRAHINAFRLMGYDIEIDEPHYVPLEIELEVCVEPGYFRSDVREALLRVFSRRTLPDGTKGMFHPDNFTFGQTVYRSRIYAAASKVAGVQSVVITKFGIQDDASTGTLNSSKIELGPLEIAQLENDRNFPKRGVLKLIMKGGK